MRGLWDGLTKPFKRLGDAAQRLHSTLDYLQASPPQRTAGQNEFTKHARSRQEGHCGVRFMPRCAPG